jgi:hypothetical protein
MDLPSSCVPGLQADEVYSGFACLSLLGRPSTGCFGGFLSLRAPRLLPIRALILFFVSVFVSVFVFAVVILDVGVVAILLILSVRGEHAFVGAYHHNLLDNAKVKAGLV